MRTILQVYKTKRTDENRRNKERGRLYGDSVNGQPCVELQHHCLAHSEKVASENIV